MPWDSMSKMQVVVDGDGFGDFEKRAAAREVAHDAMYRRAARDFDHRADAAFAAAEGAAFAVGQFLQHARLLSSPPRTTLG